jgi:DNA-binding LacI/PurR family transcriptional regulator
LQYGKYQRNLEAMSAKLSSPIQQPRLYEMVAERISKDYVEKASPGDRLPTETEFAEIYHVSVPTVREALRSLVQAGFLHRRQGSGTYRKEVPSQPAKSVSSTSRVAVISPLDLTDGSLSCHYVQVALQSVKCLSEIGMSSQIYFGETAPASERSFDDAILCQDIAAGKVSAAVVIAENMDARFPYIELLAKHQIPLIRADATASTSGKSRLLSFLDLAVDALMAQGRRKIACIGFGAEAKSNGRSEFSRIVAAKGGITDESWMIGDLHPNTRGSGYSLMREIWTTGKVKPDGLVLCDDVFFTDTALAIHELGIKSPEQLLVATYRNAGQPIRASFPVIEILYDAKVLAEQIAANVVLAVRGKALKELIVDPVVVNPFVDDAEDETSTEISLSSRTK